MKIAELLQSMTEAGVSYVVVGGLAVQLHGFMRATLDIDLVLAMDDANLDKFIGVARKYGLQPNIPVPLDVLRDAAQIDIWHREKGMLAFSLRESQPGGKVVDILVRPSVPFDRLMRNAIVGELPGGKVLIASIEDLLELKRNANRPRDWFDIEALEKIRRGEDPNG
ncbi:nucleotidyl transferase AbiEii/AbiGii toxin family protein [Sulfuricystis multivorans]|uniref:nucleotidyl transferase AbiEii/AbiGii toxin family protein n=1 Tax=Sulfuricystis multivorans TaxID=2211108 RepID=UPI000F83D2AB|nr:nucleotidyl transferase AbiEii/AbiGii toxin family protein [Sulfuricystis multivorans]